MDWQSLGPVMATLAQVIVDGANGVTQAPRVVPFIPWWQVGMLLAAVALGAAARLRPAAAIGVSLAMGLSFVPGYVQILVRRADAPARQEALVRDVERAQAAYVAQARAALMALPPGACYEPSRDAACIPYGGLHDAMARQLLPARRCMGPDPRRVVLFVGACSGAGVTARLGPP